jgi:hypothetical protein
MSFWTTILGCICAVTLKPMHTYLKVDDRRILISRVDTDVATAYPWVFPTARVRGSVNHGTRAHTSAIAIGSTPDPVFQCRSVYMVSQSDGDKPQLVVPVAYC